MKTITVDEPTHNVFKKLSSHFRRSMGEFQRDAALYFKRTGIDPATSDEQSPHKAIKVLDKRIEQVVAFIRTMEMEKFNPLLESLIILTKDLKDANLPTSEQQDKIVTGLDKILTENKTRYATEKKSDEERYKKLHDEQMASNKTMTKMLNDLIARQDTLEKTVEEKLSKKVFG